MANTSSGGWHPDPTGRHQYRWWDGTQWTDQVSDGGATSTDPMTAPPAAPVAPASGYGGPPAGRKGTNWKVIGIVGGAVLAVIVLLVVVFALGDDEGSERDEQVEVCVEGGTSRSECECVVDAYLDAGGSLDDVSFDPDNPTDPEDVSPAIVEAVFSCVEG